MTEADATMQEVAPVPTATVTQTTATQLTFPSATYIEVGASLSAVLSPPRPIQPPAKKQQTLVRAPIIGPSFFQQVAKEDVKAHRQLEARTSFSSPQAGVFTPPSTPDQAREQLVVHSTTGSGNNNNNNNNQQKNV
jgi:hypothetical protein